MPPRAVSPLPRKAHVLRVYFQDDLEPPGWMPRIVFKTLDEAPERGTVNTCPSYSWPMEGITLGDVIPVRSPERRCEYWFFGALTAASYWPYWSLEEGLTSVANHMTRWEIKNLAIPHTGNYDQDAMETSVSTIFEDYHDMVIYHYGRHAEQH